MMFDNTEQNLIKKGKHNAMDERFNLHKKFNYYMELINFVEPIRND